MNRRILLQVTAPAVLIGLLLFGACLASVWSINRLQANLADILSNNVVSLESAQELEISLRRLRFHSLLVLMDPTPARRELVEKDHQDFEAALAHARETAILPEEQRLVAEIEAGYGRYRDELEGMKDSPQSASADRFVRWADAHPVRHLVAPCEELLRLNKHAMEQTARESEAVSDRARLMMILGLTGPAAGLLAGFGIAWGLSRSLAQLRVRIEDVRAHLKAEVGPMRFASGGELQLLDRQLEQVAEQVRDVVGRMQRQQEEMLRAEQLAAIGRLAAGVAHEVRNPLTAIKMLVGVALQEGDDPKLLTSDLRVIYGEVERMEESVQNLLDFARPAAPKREPCDVRQCLTRALDLVRPRAEQQRVSVTVQQPEAPVIAAVDRGQFSTVLVNLLLNGLDAMPRGGRLDVILDASKPDEIQLVVQDTGQGIAETVAGRLFTPFTSTKPTGTGLGLSICRRVLRDHGGEILAQNRAEGGASFTVVLPTRPPEESHAQLAGCG